TVPTISRRVRKDSGNDTGARLDGAHAEGAATNQKSHRLLACRTRRRHRRVCVFSSRGSPGRPAGHHTPAALEHPVKGVLTGRKGVRQVLLEYINSDSATPKTASELMHLVARTDTSLGAVRSELIKLLDKGLIHRFEAPGVRPSVPAWRYCRL